MMGIERQRCKRRKEIGKGGNFWNEKERKKRAGEKQKRKDGN